MPKQKEPRNQNARHAPYWKHKDGPRDGHVNEQRVESKRCTRYAEGETETDPHRIEQRLKQIDFGKNTLGYDNYVKKVPK